MSGDSIPILYHQTGVKPVFVSHLFLPEKHFTKSEHQQAFFYKGVMVSLQNFAIVDTPCNGSFCDSLELISAEKSASSCACWQKDHREQTFVFSMNIIIEHPVSDVKIFCPFFTSKKTTRFLCKNAVIPVGVNTEILRSQDCTEDIIKCVRDVFGNVNCRGGWVVRGWTRRGRVKDQGVEQPSGKAAAQTTLNKEATYHLSHLEPKKFDVDDAALNLLKFDMTRALDGVLGGLFV